MTPIERAAEALAKAMKAEHRKLHSAKSDLIRCERRGGYIALLRFSAELARIQKSTRKP